MLQNKTQTDEKGDLVDDGTTLADQKIRSKRLFYLKVFVAQWAFLLASAIFGYFFVGDAVQGKIFSSLEWLQTSKVSSINDVTQFWTISDSQPSPIVTPFTTKALLLSSQNH